MATKVIMPQMGESVVEGTVSRWLKREGDPVEEFEPVVEVETDKVTSEVPAPASGMLLKVYVAEGQTVAAGELLAVIGREGEAVPDAPVAPAREDERPGSPAVARPRGGDNDRPHVTPVVARIAAEHNVDLSKVRGSGRGGRVTKKDILAYVEAGAGPAREREAQPELMPWEQPGSGDLFKPTDDLYRAVAPPRPQPPPAGEAEEGADEVMPLSTMRRRIAEHMVLSKLRTAPHVTTVFEADMSAVAAHREAHKDALARQDIRLTYTAYFMAATAQALRAYPIVNSQWTDEGIRLKRQVNIGLAVALEDGLVVPVVRNADELSLLGLARRINDLAERARRGALTPDDVSGGTFTITNHGVAGSLLATPIIHQPQSGILGIGMVQRRVVVLENDALAVRPMVYLSFSFDHRVMDGATADRFVAEIKNLLENWQ